jgi:hypothetical protein
MLRRVKQQDKPSEGSVTAGASLSLMHDLAAIIMRLSMEVGALATNTVTSSRCYGSGYGLNTSMTGTSSTSQLFTTAADPAAATASSNPAKSAEKVVPQDLCCDQDASKVTELLQPLSLHEFTAGYWEQQPLHITSPAAGVMQAPAAIESSACQRNVEHTHAAIAPQARAEQHRTSEHTQAAAAPDATATHQTGVRGTQTPTTLETNATHHRSAPAPQHLTPRAALVAPLIHNLTSLLAQATHTPPADASSLDALHQLRAWWGQARVQAHQLSVQAGAGAATPAHDRPPNLSSQTPQAAAAGTAAHVAPAAQPRLQHGPQQQDASVEQFQRKIKLQSVMPGCGPLIHGSDLRLVRVVLFPTLDAAPSERTTLSERPSSPAITAKSLVDDNGAAGLNEGTLSSPTRRLDYAFPDGAPVGLSDIQAAFKVGLQADWEPTMRNHPSQTCVLASWLGILAVQAGYTLPSMSCHVMALAVHAGCTQAGFDTPCTKAGCAPHTLCHRTATPLHCGRLAAGLHPSRAFSQPWGRHLGCLLEQTSISPLQVILCLYLVSAGISLCLSPAGTCDKCW